MSEMKPVGYITPAQLQVLQGFGGAGQVQIKVRTRADDSHTVALAAIHADQVLVPRALLSRVEESLRCEIEERYAGTKDHPAIRTKYLRDITEADELRTLLHP